MHVLERADRRNNHNWQCQPVRIGLDLIYQRIVPVRDDQVRHARC